MGRGLFVYGVIGLLQRLEAVYSLDFAFMNR